MRKLQTLGLLLAFFGLMLSCENKQQTSKEGVEATQSTLQTDMLPSWNESESKQAIVDYVTSITAKGPDFVPVSDRIAVFDNDGTLWSEQPMYFQLFFAIDRVKAMAADHPEWKEQQPFKALLENDMKTFLSFGEHGILEVVMASHAGMTVSEFDQIVRDWLKTAKHPKFDKPYTELVYKPMLELLDYLRANDFKVFIVSGGGIEFMRPWTEAVYGVPTDQVVGSSIKTKYDYNDGNPLIRRLPELNFIDDKEGKPEGINQHIGKKPIFAGGNSDGDLEMLRWTDSNSYPSFQLYIHHTDGEREWAYDRESSIGRFDKGLDEGREKGWTIVDMKTDWSVIYPFQR
jgi:phosphoserine phosphatase